MTRISWIEKKSNERVLAEVNERRSLMESIQRRKIKLIGHLIRHNEVMKNIFEGKIQVRRSRGRPRISYFKDILTTMNASSYSHMKFMTVIRSKWLSRQGIAFRN